MGRNTKIQLRRGTANQWRDANPSAILAEGEIGYEIDTGRFKIGKTGGSLWSALPYAGGSDILAGSGIATLFDSATNSYTISSVIESSGNGLSVGKINFNGNGLSAPSGSYYEIGLSNRLQNLSNLNTSGIIVSTNTSGVITRELSSGSNINISNANGILANPVISLNSSLTGLSSIYSLDNNSTISGFNINAPTGTFSLIETNNLSINGNADFGNPGFNYIGIFRYLSVLMDAKCTNTVKSRECNVVIEALSGLTNVTASGINLTAQNASGNAGTINISGSSINVSGQTNFNTLPNVNGTGISLVGHNHSWSDVIDKTGFCDDVADCVDTSLLASTGIQLSYNSSNNSINIALSGQSLKLHNLNTDGLIVRDNGDIVSRSIVASGTNILVGSGNGVGGNPNIGLNPNLSIDTLSTSSSATIGTNLTVQGNLVVNGDTVTTNVSSIQVEDPTIRLGATTGVLSDSDVLDRGIEFVYRRSGTVPITGFFGYDYSADAFVFLKSATNSSEIYSGVSGLINVGGLYSSAGISGTVLTSTIVSPTAPIAVSSTGQVNNLNSDYLDGQHGSYYRDASSITGLASLDSGVLPSITAYSSSAVSATNLFITSLTVDRAGRTLSSTTGVHIDATDAIKGIASFSNSNFNITTGAVSIKNGGISNDNLANKTIGIGGTNISLGGNFNDISGIATLVANTSVSGSYLYGNGSNITNLNASNISAGTIGVTYLPNNIPITNLSQSGLYFGTTSYFQSLGSTVTDLRELASISGTSSSSPTILTYCSIDGGTP